MRATSALAAAPPVKPKSAATSDTTSMMSAHFSNDMGRIHVGRINRPAEI
jgi:hypothetical protein